MVFGLDASLVSVANGLAPFTAVDVAMGLGLWAPFLFVAGRVRACVGHGSVRRLCAPIATAVLERALCLA